MRGWGGTELRIPLRFLFYDTTRWEEKTGTEIYVGSEIFPAVHRDSPTLQGSVCILYYSFRNLSVCPQRA